MGGPGWLSQLSVQLLVSAQVMISQFVGSIPVSGSVLTAQSLEPALDSVYPPLSASPLLMGGLSFSLSLPPNKQTLEIKKRGRLGDSVG